MDVFLISFACELICTFFVSAFAAVYTEAKDIHGKQRQLVPSNEFYKNEYVVPELQKFLPKFPYPVQNVPVMTSRVIPENKIPPISNVFPDSRIFYFRMPFSSPYFYLTELNGLIGHPQPPAFTDYDMMSSSYPIHLPITFTSNGKPSGIYKFQQNDLSSTKPVSKPTAKPPSTPNSNIINLNKGPYTFNGKPSDIYLLQDSFNSLFSNSLSNFYP